MADAQSLSGSECCLGPLQTQWLKALESGKYKQGINKLHTIDDKFCCLGVACNLFSTSPPTVFECITGKVYRYDGEFNYLPAEIVNKLKLHTNMGLDIANNIHLTTLNDEGASFLEIAQKVRANPSHFFREPA
jgi:hypothetical protein